MPGVEIHANLIDTVISAILYYTSNKKAKNIYDQSIKKGLSEEESLNESKKVKISGAPFLKSGVKMKFYEAFFTIALGFLITVRVSAGAPFILARYLGFS